MHDFLWGFLLRCAVMIPAILLTSAAMWLLLRKLGVMRLDEPFDAGDMRTWPLSYAVAEGFLFAVVFAAIAAALGDSKFSVSVGAGVAALIALGIAPILLIRFKNKKP